MQYAVPQFTEVEDKLIGPLTLKQFLIILATGGIVMFFYSLLKLSIFFYFFAIPTSLLGLGLTFGKFNGRPLFSYIGVFVAFTSRPQVRIFKREDVSVNMSFKTEKKAETIVLAKNKLDEPNESRVKKLAYLLDQKTEEEKKLLEQKS